jgi:hypothetical protein
MAEAEASELIRSWAKVSAGLFLLVTVVDYCTHG